MFEILFGKKETIEEQNSIKNLDVILFDILTQDKDNKKNNKSIKDIKKENNKNIKKVVKHLNTFMVENK